MRYTFKPDDRLSWPLIILLNHVFFIILRANFRHLIIMQCLHHLIPFQHIYLVFTLAETLTSSTEIYLHRITIICMFMQIQALIVNRLCRIQCSSHLGREPGVLVKYSSWASNSFSDQRVHRQARPLHARSMEHFVGRSVKVKLFIFLQRLSLIVPDL